MACGIRNIILHVIVVLYVTRTILGEIDAYKIRRNTDRSSANSNYWTQQSDNLNELRKEIYASLPADLPGIILNSKTRESTHSGDLSNLDNLDNVAEDDGVIDAKGKLALYNLMSKQPARHTFEDELDKRNGFFFGKRNGFFFGKRKADNTESCVKCGPQNSGACVMYGTCCSPQFGCYIMTKESEVCTQANIGRGCLNLDNAPHCGRRGKCVANDVCCSPQDGACHIDLSCSTDNATIA